MTLRTNIKATNMELTEAIRDYLLEKLETLKRVLPADDESVIIDAEIGKDTRHHQHGEVFKAELNLHLRGRQLYATTTEKDLYAAIDLVRDELTRQIISASAKRLTLVRRGGRALKGLLRGLNPWKKRYD